MAIRVCDAIMGMGKSQSAIAYMNDNLDKKFIYITPYLDEAARIRKGCPALNFVEPSNQISEYGYSKIGHTAALISEGRNITTTHQAFKNYSPSLLETIRGMGYTLIIDENVDILSPLNINASDLELLIASGYIRNDNGVYHSVRDDYNGVVFRDFFNTLKCRGFMSVNTQSTGNLFYWVLTPELLTSFDDVYILTYMFKGQSIRYLLDMYNLEYEFVTIDKKDGQYRFAESGYTPEYISEIKSKIEIVDGRVNDVGDDPFALSMNWFKNNDEGCRQLKNNMDNFFNNIKRGKPASKRLWGAYSSAENKLRGKGYTNAYTPFNMKATNIYSDRDTLAYPANPFMNVGEKAFYQSQGLEVDEDMYSLSILVQWIWRSAIRNGQDISLYIPSSRMRNLLINWLNNLGGGETAQ